MPLTEHDPAKLWTTYLHLVAVEEAFKNLKGDLAIGPIFHQDEHRIEAHIFIAFLAIVSTSRSADACMPSRPASPHVDKFSARQMIDVNVPATDGRELHLVRHTEPEPELNLLLHKLKLELPAQPPPKITAPAADPTASV